MLSEIAPGFKPNIWGDELVAFSPKDSIPTARRRLRIASSDGKCTSGERSNPARRGTAASALPPFNPAGLVARPRRGVDQTEPKEVLTIEIYGNPAAKFRNILENGDSVIHRVPTSVRGEKGGGPFVRETPNLPLASGAFPLGATHLVLDGEASRASNVRGCAFAFLLFQDTVASARFVDSVSGMRIGTPEAAVNRHAVRRRGVSS
jgi:hypothetical protein